MITISYPVFANQAENHGLESRDCGKGHWQVWGERLLVNFYPYSRGGMKVYVAGTVEGRRIESLQEVFDAAIKPPPVLAKPYRNGRDRYFNRDRKKKLLKQDPHCCWCGCRLFRKTATLDHVIPLSRGGLDNGNNVVLACGPCNKLRGSDMPELTNETFYLEPKPQQKEQTC